MSTRATYGFFSSRPSQERVDPVYIYVHYDNYPEGAAEYLYETAILENQRAGRGMWVEPFIRANPYAELTKSHDVHADTEYQYDIFGVGVEAGLIARRVKLDVDAPPTSWEVFYEGTVLGFIRQHHDRQRSAFKDFIHTDVCGNSIPVWHNDVTALRYINSILDTIKRRKQKDIVSTTITYTRQDLSMLAKIFDAFPSLRDDAAWVEFSEFLTEYGTQDNITV